MVCYECATVPAFCGDSQVTALSWKPISQYTGSDADDGKDEIHCKVADNQKAPCKYQYLGRQESTSTYRHCRSRHSIYIRQACEPTIQISITQIDQGAHQVEAAFNEHIVWAGRVSTEAGPVKLGHIAKCIRQKMAVDNVCSSTGKATWIWKDRKITTNTCIVKKQGKRRGTQKQGT